MNCKLTLGSSDVRINPNLDSESLKSNLGAINAIVTSNAQNDDGMFESNFRDERYLPFEGAGVISLWDLELPDFRQYDYSTISDVIIHISYTAVAEEGEFKKDVIAEYKSLLNNASEQGLFRLFDLKHDFPNEWHRFTNEETDNFEAILKEEHFPYYAPSPRRTIVDKKLYSIKPDGTLDPNGKIDLSSTEMRIEIERTDLVTELESFVIVRFTIDEKN
ncbi:hypothetical protein M601_018975 [Cellulophaga baltica 4]|nr:hypothetical protein M601_018975 [Cellulophaga baltica 4]